MERSCDEIPDSLLEVGCEVFGSEELFQRWLNEPCEMFGGMEPIDLLKNEDGITLLIDTLVSLAG